MLAASILVPFVIAIQHIHDYIMTWKRPSSYWLSMYRRLLILIGLLPDTWNNLLRMRRECRECFPRHRLPREPLVSDPDCITALASRTCRDACRYPQHAVAGKTSHAFLMHAQPVRGPLRQIGAVVLLYFPHPDWTVDQTVDFSMILDTLMPIWRHCIVITYLCGINTIYWKLKTISRVAPLPLLEQELLLELMAVFSRLPFTKIPFTKKTTIPYDSCHVNKWQCSMSPSNRDPVIIWFIRLSI